MKHQNVKPLIFDTYLAVIKNSVGAKVWRNFYASVRGTKKDIMENGNLSCAFFVSSILALFGFIKKSHGTVEGTLEDMKRSGWRKIRNPRVGGVLVWEAQKGRRGEMHKHIGFYIGNRRAISNSSSRRFPVKHHWTFGAKRKIEEILWHRKLV